MPVTTTKAAIGAAIPPSPATAEAPMPQTKALMPQMWMDTEALANRVREAAPGWSSVPSFAGPVAALMLAADQLVAREKERSTRGALLQVRAALRGAGPAQTTKVLDVLARHGSVAAALEALTELSET